jgi:hypothetical protein
MCELFALKNPQRLATSRSSLPTPPDGACCGGHLDRGL